MACPRYSTPSLLLPATTAAPSPALNAGALFHNTALAMSIEYRGKIFEEMDRQAVIDRHPGWVLVDELAHTNVPGAGELKRWQGVDEIPEAGVNVISTVNVPSRVSGAATGNPRRFRRAPRSA